MRLSKSRQLLYVCITSALLIPSTLQPNRLLAQPIAIESPSAAQNTVTIDEPAVQSETTKSDNSEDSSAVQVVEETAAADQPAPPADSANADTPASDTEPSSAPQASQSDPEPTSEKTATEKTVVDNQESTKRPARKVTPREPIVTQKQLRQITLSGEYVDLATSSNIDPTSLLLGGMPGKTKSFYKLCDLIDEIAEDDSIQFVLFNLSDGNLVMNSAQQDELSRRLAKCKSKGKKLIAWLQDASNVHLSIASQCDEIFMSDLGSVDMPSQAMNTMFYRDAMDLIGVKASVVRAGDFKGAVEPYMNPVMSEGLRSHYIDMLESLNSSRISRISKGRGLTTASVRELQRKRILSANEALAAGLVTRIAPLGTMEKSVKDFVGSEISWSKPKPKAKNEISLFDVLRMSSSKGSKTKLKTDSIAVLHLQGAIVDGKSNSAGEIVSEPTAKVIQDLASNDKVKAVVVRINSPGGSATASEIIRQELSQLASKKPVIFSMGEMAASGGYWITCIGKPIYAERSTITGSIGVFTMKMSFGSLFRRVGVHVESVALDPAAEQDSMARPWTEDDVAGVQKFIDQIYDRFLSIANESRKIPIEKLKDLAGGRVWSGEQAKANGLVDELGGLDDSLVAVAKVASLDKYDVVHYPEESDSFNLFSLLNDSDEEEIKIPALQINWESQLINQFEALGLKLDNFKTLLKGTLQSTQSRPQVWALLPMEMKVK